MISSTERPFTFFFYFINNFNEYVENNFYTNYSNLLNCTNIDRENGIIDHYEIDIDNNHVFYQEKLQDFLQKRILNESDISRTLIANNVRKLSSTDASPTNYLKFIEDDLIQLNKLSQNLNDLFLNKQLFFLTKDFSTKYYRFISFKKQFLVILSIDRSNVILNKKIILSFNWNSIYLEKIELLYNKLKDVSPPLIDCEFIIFKKAFTGQEIYSHEGIKWLCKNVNNKKTISKITLIRFIEMLYENQFIKNDKNDFNKIIENIFTDPNGEKLKNIKVSKASAKKSKSPSRLQEIIEIIDSLTQIP